MSCMWNAAIEVFHAGEQRRGFCCCCRCEVRKLAEHTLKSHQKIHTQIKRIQSETHQVASAIHEGTNEVRRGEALAQDSESMRR